MITLVEKLDDSPMSNFLDLIGFIPSFLNERDERSAKEQIDLNYNHGGGWQKFDGFSIVKDDPMTIAYPGDPELQAIARMTLHNETIYIFPFAWVMIMQDDGTWEIARID